MAQILDFEKDIFAVESQIRELYSLSNMYDSVGDLTHEIAKLKKKLRHMKRDVFNGLDGWQKTQVARHPRASPTRWIISITCSRISRSCMGIGMEEQGFRSRAGLPSLITRRLW